MIVRMLPLVLALYASGAVSDQVVAWQAESPNQQVQLLELYTSQGCSSCPPADTWLLAMARSDPHFRTVVPVAFHVTYWNALGWPDEFAQVAFDARQRETARRANARVYTPGIFLSGEEWRQWRSGEPVPEGSPVGVLAFQGISGSSTQFRFSPKQPINSNVILHVAFLTKEATTRVRRGENRGRRLPEGYIVRTHRALNMRCEKTCEVEASLEPPEGTNILVAWVTDQHGTHLQATGAHF